MPLDQEDLEKIQTLIGAGLSEALVPTINKALDARLKGVVTTEQLDQIKADQAEAQRKAAEAAATSAAAASEGNNDSVQTSPEYRKAMAKIEELERQTISERQAREAAEQRRLQELRHSMIREALGNAGVDARVQTAATHTLLGEGLVHITDEGGVVFRKANEFGGVDESTVDAGVKAYLAAEGKIFLPADPVRGAGGNGGPNGAPFRQPTEGSQEADPEAIVLQAMAGF